jgi:hypothetical protein
MTQKWRASRPPYRGNDCSFRPKARRRFPVKQEPGDRVNGARLKESPLLDRKTYDAIVGGVNPFVRSALEINRYLGIAGQLAEGIRTRWGCRSTDTTSVCQPIMLGFMRLLVA